MNLALFFTKYYKLFLGGADYLTKERKWNKIATRMGYPNNKNLGNLLKSHYERIIHPYDIFTKGKSVKVVRQ